MTTKLEVTLQKDNTEVNKFIVEDGEDLLTAAKWIDANCDDWDCAFLVMKRAHDPDHGGMGGPYYRRGKDPYDKDVA